MKKVVGEMDNLLKGDGSAIMVIDGEEKKVVEEDPVSQAPAPKEEEDIPMPEEESQRIFGEDDNFGGGFGGSAIEFSQPPADEIFFEEVFEKHASDY